jgi:hypothetical protein
MNQDDWEAVSPYIAIAACCGIALLLSLFCFGNWPKRLLLASQRNRLLASVGYALRNGVASGGDDNETLVIYGKAARLLGIVNEEIFIWSDLAVALDFEQRVSRTTIERELGRRIAKHLGICVGNNFSSELSDRYQRDWDIVAEKMRILHLEKRYGTLPIPFIVYALTRFWDVIPPKPSIV